MSERHQSFLHELANGELDEEERELGLAELYGSGLFDDPVPWSSEGQPASEGDVDGCLPRVGGSEHTGQSDASVSPANYRLSDGPTVPVSPQGPRGSVVPLASAAPHDERDGAEPVDVREQSGEGALRLRRAAVRR